MKLRMCKCGGIPKLNGFVIRCNSCGTLTHCYMDIALAIKDWNEEIDLLEKRPFNPWDYRVSSEQAMEIIFSL